MELKRVSGKQKHPFKDVSHVLDGTEKDIPLFIFMAVRRTVVYGSDVSGFKTRQW